MNRQNRVIPPVILEFVSFTVILLLLAVSGQTKTDYFELGVQQAMEGNPKKAVKWLNKAIELDPQNADAYYNRALAFQHMGEQEEAAVADYSMCIRLRPTDVDAYSNRAVAHMRLKEYYAIADLEKGISIQPDHALSYLNLGMVYKLVGHDDAACNNWQNAAKLGNTQAIQLVADCHD